MLSLLALLTVGLTVGAISHFYFRGRCKAYVDKQYEVEFDWDGGAKRFRFVDARTHSEETSRQLHAAALKAATEEVEKLITSTKLTKASGSARLALQGCDEPYLVRWSDWEIPKLSELMGAADAWNLSELQGLLAAGLNVNARGAGGMTPLMWAATDPNRKVPQGAVPKLSWKLDGRTVEFLLQSGADPNAADLQGLSVLMHADGSTAPQLLAAGARVNARDNLGLTPLMHSSRKKDVQALKLEIQAHAEVNATDQNGWSALMYAAIAGSPESVETLLAAGADKSMRNKSGQTALDLAEGRRQDGAQFRSVVDILSKNQ